MYFIIKFYLNIKHIKVFTDKTKSIEEEISKHEH